MMNQVELHKVCDVIAGQSPPSSTYNQEGEGIPFFQGKADFGELYPTVRYWCTAPKKLSEPNDILFSLRAPVGPTNINNIQSSIGRGLAAIRCHDEIELKYLLHYLRGNEERIAALGTGSTFKAIKIGTLKDLKIPLPPLETQRKIAAILDTADEYRQKTKALIDKYDELAQSLFLDMFGDPVTNPKGWEKKSLSDITTKIGSGATPKGGKSAYKAEGISLVRSMNVYDSKFKYDQLAFIDEDQAKKLDNVSLVEKDVLFNITGASVCRCTIVPDRILPARVNQHVAILRAYQNVMLPEFLMSTMISPHVKTSLLGVSSQGGATREAITKSQLEEFEIPVPDMELQVNFTSALANSWKQKALLEKEVSSSEQLFNSLLQKAFKGEL